MHGRVTFSATYDAHPFKHEMGTIVEVYIAYWKVFHGVMGPTSPQNFANVPGFIDQSINPGGFPLY